MKSHIIKLFVISIFLISCTRVYLYDRKERKPVNAIVRKRNYFYEKQVNKDIQFYRLYSKGLIYKNITYLLFDDNTFSTYNYLLRMDGSWEIRKDTLFLMNKVILDSISSIEVFYSKSNFSDSTLIYCLFDGFRGHHILQGIRLFYSENNYDYYYLDPYQLKAPKNIQAIQIDFFGKLLEKKRVIVSDTILLKINILPKEICSIDTVNLKDATVTKYIDRVKWYIVDSDKIKKKRIDGAKILVPSSMEN